MRAFRERVRDRLADVAVADHLTTVVDRYGQPSDLWAASAWRYRCGTGKVTAIPAGCGTCRRADRSPGASACRATSPAYSGRRAATSTNYAGADDLAERRLDQHYGLLPEM